MNTPSAQDAWQEVIKFWYEESTYENWFQKNEAYDNKIKSRFLELHTQATQGELAHWRNHSLGALAEVIVLDQFSRNIYRNQAQAFTYDGMALILAQRAIELKLDQELNTDQKWFLYMPFMHSESKLIHEQAVPVFEALGLPDVLKFELAHKVIIDRFGRYPHRNQTLGRTSTTEEIEFLKQDGSSF